MLWIILVHVLEKQQQSWQTISKYFSNTENVNRNAMELIFCTDLMSSVLTSYRRGQQGLDLPAVPGFKLMIFCLASLLTPWWWWQQRIREYGKKLSVLASLGKGNLNEKNPSLNCPMGQPIDGWCVRANLTVGGAIFGLVTVSPHSSVASFSSCLDPGSWTEFLVWIPKMMECKR